MRPMLVTVLGVFLAWPGAAELAFRSDIEGCFDDISSTGIHLQLEDDGAVRLDPDQTQFLAETELRGGNGAVWVSNNGALGFLDEGGESGAFYRNAHIPSFALFGGAHGAPQALAPFWDDLNSPTSDPAHGAFWQVKGEVGSRVLIVQWHDKGHYPTTLDGVTFQVKIFEDPQLPVAQLIYHDVCFNYSIDPSWPSWERGGSATVGYQAGGIENDIEWSFNGLAPDGMPAQLEDGLVLTLASQAVSYPASVGCDGTPQTPTVAGGCNDPPVADAGPDQVVQATWPDGTAEVELDGSASFDPEGEPLTYRWEEEGVFRAYGSMPILVMDPGEHVLSLEVGDGTYTDRDHVLVRVEATIEGLGGLVVEAIDAGEIDDGVAANALVYVDRAAIAESRARFDHAIRSLDQFKHEIGKGRDKGLVALESALELRGSADAVIGELSGSGR